MNSQVQEIELDIENAKQFVELHECAERLKKNKDFQKLILEEYFKNESVRLVEALSAPALQDEKYQKAITKTMEGIGQLKQFFNKVHHQAEMAKTAIEEGQEALSEMAEQGDL